MAELITDFYARDYKNGSPNHTEWKSLEDRVTMPVGYKYSDSNWVTVFKFNLPTAAKSITFTFYCGDYTPNFNAILNYKFTTSEDENLLNSIATISGAVATSGDGSFELKGKSSGQSLVKSTVTIEKKLSAGTYYMYMWTGRTSSYPYNYYMFRIYNDEWGISATYEKVDAVVYIDNGTGFDAYEIWIDNGIEWEQYIPYIDNGSDWDECG